MINVSNAFREKMQTDTGFLLTAEIAFTDGRRKTLQQFAMSGSALEDGSSASSVPLGSAVQKTLKLEIENYEDQYADYDFYGAEIHLRIGLALTESTTEMADYGYYTVVEPETYGYTIQMQAADAMYKANVPFETGLTFPCSAGALFRDGCTRCGIQIGSASFRNDSFVIPSAPEKATWREVFGYIAMIAVGNARIGYDGRLYILEYDFTDEPLHSFTRWLNPPSAGTDTITVTGVRMELEDDEILLEGEEGYVLTLQNPLVKGTELQFLQLTASVMVGAQFRPFSGEHIGYPIAEFMDPCEVTDVRGRTFTTFLTDIEFAFYGATGLANSAEPPIRNSSSYTSEAASSYQRARQLVRREQTAREVAIQNLTQQLANSSGLYTTIDPQQDGSKIYYLHNKPTLAESDFIWKMTAEAWAVSNDGGESWNAGISVDGTAIVRILQATGVNANWINAGTFEVLDDNDNVIFSADKDTGRVYISGQSVQIGGSSLPDVLDDTTSLTVFLDNEYQGVNTDGSSFPECRTKAAVYYGSRNVTTSCTITAQASTGVTGTWNGVDTYTVTGLSSDSGYVDITAVFRNITATKRFNISRIQDGENGEDAVVLRIDSSRGNVFKNNSVSTVLTVTIHSGSERITNITALRARFGQSAHLQWYWQRIGDNTYGEILASDSKLSDNGFSLTLTPADVDTKVTFMCELVV